MQWQELYEEMHTKLEEKNAVNDILINRIQELQPFEYENKELYKTIMSIQNELTVKNNENMHLKDTIKNLQNHISEIEKENYDLLNQLNIANQIIQESNTIYNIEETSENTENLDEIDGHGWPYGNNLMPDIKERDPNDGKSYFGLKKITRALTMTEEQKKVLFKNLSHVN